VVRQARGRALQTLHGQGRVKHTDIKNPAEGAGFLWGVAFAAIDSGNTAFKQTIRTTFSNAAFDQTIRTTFSNAAFDQTIRATFSHTAFDQFVRTALSDQGVGRGSGESVDSEDRESDTEKSLAFHDGVLRGVVGWYGADVTPEIFYENFIAVMMNIDSNDG
jgi:hypothetical protein